MTPKNLASDEATLTACLRDLGGSAEESATSSSTNILVQTRRDRTTMQETWLDYHAIWAGRRNRQSYQGRSKSYLAVGRKVIESWVAKLKKDLFATDPNFEVQATREVFSERATNLKALYDYFIRTQMCVRRKAGPHLRQLVTYGTAPIHVGWRAEGDTVPTLKSLPGPGQRTKVEMEKIMRYYGPTMRVVDLFAWYIYPTTALDVDDAELVFEDQLVTMDRLEAMAKTPCVPEKPDRGMLVDPTALESLKLRRRYDNGLDASRDQSPREKFDAERRRLARKGFTQRLDDANQVASVVDVSLVYRKANYDGEGTTWWEILLACDQYPLRIRKNPWWHGKPPWLAPKFVEVVNEFYGYGLPGVFDRLQYWIVDVMDQASDGLTYSMNPIAVIDQFKVQDPTSIRFRAGAKWLAEPDGVHFMEPPKETASIGMAAIQQGIALMNDMANVAPTGFGGSTPRSRGRAASTATGAQILLSESLVELHDVIENCEDQWLAPMLSMMHKLTMQCMDKTMVLRIAGQDGVSLVEQSISAQDTIGDYEFRWLGSLHTMNQQVRAQQMVNFLQIVSQIPPPMLEMQNAEVAMKDLLRTIWSDGFGLRDANRIIRDKIKIKSVDPLIENELAKIGRGDELYVSPGDNDQKHAQAHLEGARDPKMPEGAKAILIHHVEQHVAAHLAKQAMQEQQEAQQMAGGMLGGGGGGAGPGANGMARAPRAPGRLAQTTGADDVMRRADRPTGGTNTGM